MSQEARSHSHQPAMRERTKKGCTGHRGRHKSTEQAPSPEQSRPTSAPTYTCREFCTRMYNQLTASRTPVLTISPQFVAETYPSRADTPSTSRLAMRSTKASSGSSAVCDMGLLVGDRSARLGRARCHASKASRTSATVRDVDLSCLFARRRRGRLRRRGELRTSSDVS